MAPPPKAASKGARPRPGSTDRVSGPSAKRPEKRAQGEVLYGVRSALAAWTTRPADVLAVAYDPAIADAIEQLVAWAERESIACSATPTAQLTELAGSSQHEGVVLTVRARDYLSPRQAAAELAQTAGLCVALDRVRNPQNVGAIVRSAAYFGVDGVLLGAPTPEADLTAFAQRVAEGGAEHLWFSRTTDLADTLRRWRESGVRVVGTDSHADSDPAALTPGSPTVLVVGHEREGLSPRVRAQCDTVVGIEGSGRMDSLNVAVAAGVLFSKLFANWQK